MWFMTPTPSWWRYYYGSRDPLTWLEEMLLCMDQEILHLVSWDVVVDQDFLRLVGGETIVDQEIPSPG
jgi:hypothetical protein